jgi:tripartite-type tricarboxylate transporter receptor subunit TctC
MVRALQAAAGWALLALVAAAAPSDAAYAQNYPMRPVRVVVPQPPGGGTDIVARVISEQLSRQLGQQFIVDNRPGAGTVVGTDAAAKAAPDGYTLVMGLNANMAVNPSLFPNLPYDPVKDFTAVAMIVTFPFLVVVSNNFPAKSIADLVALGKSKPGQYHFASAGNGTGQHLSMEYFKLLTKTDFVHVPYKGAQAAYADVITGQVPVFFDNIAAALPQVKAGRVRALAVTTAQRSPVAPDIPTVSESGLPGYEYHTWFGMWAPAATPSDIVAKLHAEVRKAMATNDVRDRFANLAGQPSSMTREEVGPFVKAEIERWAKVVNEAKVKPD